MLRSIIFMSSVIGFSTAFLKWRLGINEAIDVIQKNGFNAIMLSYETPLKLMQEIGDHHLSMLSGFDYVAIHAPYVKVRYGPKSRMILSRLAFLKKVTGAKHVVFHPDLVDDWRIIRNSRLPVAIENMDSSCSFGTTFEHMKFMKERGLDIALDVAHAYSMDRTFALARKLLKLGPVHLHVSGSTDGKGHLLLSASRNRDKVMALLRSCRSVPWIMEMQFFRRDDKAMKRERSLLESHYKK